MATFTVRDIAASALGKDVVYSLVIEGERSFIHLNIDEGCAVFELVEDEETAVRINNQLVEYIQELLRFR